MVLATAALLVMVVLAVAAVALLLSGRAGLVGTPLHLAPGHVDYRQQNWVWKEQYWPGEKRGQAPTWAIEVASIQVIAVMRKRQR